MNISSQVVREQVADYSVQEDEIDLAVKGAVIDALRDHKRAGNPVAIWEDGKVKIVPPEEIVLPGEEATD